MPNRRCAAAATFGAGVATAGAGHRYNDENDAVKSAHSPNLRCPPLHFSLDLTWMPLPIIPSKCPVVIPRPAAPRSRGINGPPSASLPASGSGETRLSFVIQQDTGGKWTRPDTVLNCGDEARLCLK